MAVGCRIKFNGCSCQHSNEPSHSTLVGVSSVSVWLRSFNFKGEFCPGS
jgi:hypothetical protein